MSTSTPTAPTSPRSRPPRAARRAGYAISVAVNLLLLWLLNIEPGWSALPLLTERFTDVIALVNASLVVGGALNLGYLAFDPLWARRLGDAVSAAFGCVVMVRLWSVFPFDLGSWEGWTTALRILLVLGAVGAGIGVIANLAEMVRQASRPENTS
jgi:hypothetical protein